MALPSWAPTSYPKGALRSSGNCLFRLHLAETFHGLVTPCAIRFASRHFYQASHNAQNSRVSHSCSYANGTPVSLPSLSQSKKIPFHIGAPVDNELVYRKTFGIRSYEVGFDGTAPITTITNLFQETSLNHAGTMKFVGDGMGTTQAMTRNRLIWVVTRMHIEMMQYPAWEDVVQIDSWVSSSGKNGMRRDFILWDYATGCMLGRATSNWAMMNQDTRRLSKMPEEVRDEISQVFLECSAMDEEHYPLEKIRCCDGLTPFRVMGLVSKVQDLDMNQHVNNVKYIDWVLECIPESLLMSCELSKMILEYRRECGKSDIVDSFAQPDMANRYDSSISFLHSLRLRDSAIEVLRGCTQWTPKMQCYRH